MKRIFIIFFAMLAMNQIITAQQTPISDPIVHITENGSNTGYGTQPFWLNAITIDRFLINLYNGVYSGDITVYIAGGDYYTPLKFWGVPNIIQSISLYGGFNPIDYSSYGLLPNRDLVTYETRLHAKEEPAIWYEAVGYNHINGWKTCRVDGITITTGGNWIDVSALRLVGGDHIISQCKIENFKTSKWLIWLETGGNHVTFTNCLFDNNRASHLIALGSHVDIINTTIADNHLDYDMFLSFWSYNTPYTYNLRNSIIYSNNNMLMGTGYFNVSNSILENYESWVNNIGSNYFNTDPEFTYNIVHPYTCNTSISPAIGNGNPAFILSCPYYDNIIMNYDVINTFRFSVVTTLTIDIGAYQHSLSSNRAKKRNSDSVNSSIQIWTNANTLYVNNVEESEATLSLYNAAGQIIYSTSLQTGYNTIPLTLNDGMYIASITDKKGKEIKSSKIVIL